MIARRAARFSVRCGEHVSRQKMGRWKIVVLLWGCLILLAVLILPVSVSARGEQHRGAQKNGSIAWPAAYFAPYLNDMSNENDLLMLSQESGAHFFTLAFIESSRGKDCQATWNTRQPIGEFMRASINALRARGGDVRVAFGGSSNSELAVTCQTLRDLQAQYQAVITAYNLSHIDFDIEGQTLRDSQATERRNLAIAALQRQFARAGKPLTVSYTLPVETTGLKESSLNLLRNAIQDGVHIRAINLMTMDYYSQRAPGDHMARNAIAAATSVQHQLQELYPARSANQIWNMLGLTPMIGVNDNTSEIFSLQDAQTLLLFAEQKHFPLLAFWSIGRDKACGSDQNAPHGCSGVKQHPYAYAQAFAAFRMVA